MSQVFRNSCNAKNWSSKIFIVEDHELVREGLRGLISTQSDLEICGEAVNVCEARKMLQELEPDVVILDLSLPDASGLDLFKFIMKKRPMTKVIVSTMHDEKDYGERVLRLGAKGYVNKRSSSKSMLAAIRRVVSGELSFTKEFINQIVRRVGSHPTSENESALSILSDRELEVLELIGQGLTTKMIANRLFLSHNTIGTYRVRLKVKLDLKSSTELTRFAIRWLEDRDSQIGG